MGSIDSIVQKYFWGTGSALEEQKNNNNNPGLQKKIEKIEIQNTQTIIHFMCQINTDNWTC